MSTANQIFSSGVNPSSSMAGTKIGTTMKVISRNSRLMPNRNTATMAMTTKPHLPPPIEVSHCDVWSEPPSWKNMALKNVEQNSSVITSTTTLAVERAAFLTAGQSSRQPDPLMWVAPSLISRLSNSQFSPVNTSAPKTPTAPDSDGVAMPWKMDTSTPRISTSMGTMAMSTSAASIRVRHRTVSTPTKVTAPAVSEAEGPANSMTALTINPRISAMTALVRSDGLPARVRCSTGMAGPTEGRSHDSTST